MVPTLPLLAPASALAASAKGRERQNPKRIEAVIVENKANVITGFLPYLSEALPIAIPVHDWLSENEADNHPAYKDGLVVDG